MLLEIKDNWLPTEKCKLVFKSLT